MRQASQSLRDIMSRDTAGLQQLLDTPSPYSPDCVEEKFSEVQRSKRTGLGAGDAPRGGKEASVGASTG
jgi:hypothetical protein